ncbi:two-component system activity regulator YycH [Laceyella putida]|uniref:Two-component system activity regulator YycH n=1 Tax=Laceyella putida TaxID=110101 RepID=A0ABW2RGN0_9BACL
MEQKWVEHIKTVVLIILVTLSFVLTGFLWFYSPGYQQKPDGYRPPTVLTGDKYNEKNSRQFVAPYQLIVTQGGKTTWIHPDREEYQSIVNSIRDANITQFEKISHVKSEEWKKRLLDGPSLQLQFARDVNVESLDAFFKASILEQFSLHLPAETSRILLYVNGGQPQIWLISDDTGEIWQAALHLDPSALEKAMGQARQQAQVELAPVVANGKMPWDKANENLPWSRIFYLPTTPPPLPTWNYKTEQIEIDDIKEWLLTSSKVEPIVIHDENLYMSEDQRLIYNKRVNSLQYSEDVPAEESKNLMVEDQLYDINKFVQRHRGWTGDYLLDWVEPVKEEAETNQFTFRRIIAGLPVYWNQPSEQTIYPDVLQFQAGASGGADGIKQYVRSASYMIEGTRTGEANLLDRDEVLRQLSERKIPLTAIEQISPGYEAKFYNANKIQLTPVWVVLTTAGKQFLIGSPTS